MGDVGGRFALVYHNPVLVRAKYVAGAQHGLPTGGHPAAGRENIVLTAALVKFRPFNGGVLDVPIEDQCIFAQHFHAIGTQACDRVEQPTAGRGRGSNSANHLNETFIFFTGCSGTISRRLLPYYQ